MNLQKLHQPRTFVLISIVTIVFFALASFNSYAHATSLPINDTCLQLDRVLSFGKRGDDVRKLQTHLIDFEYLTGNATGIFGTKTRAALKSLQADEGLSQTGKTDTETRARLKVLSCDLNESDTESGTTTPAVGVGIVPPILLDDNSIIPKTIQIPMPIVPVCRPPRDLTAATNGVKEPDYNCLDSATPQIPPKIILRDPTIPRMPVPICPPRDLTASTNSLKDFNYNCLDAVTKETTTQLTPSSVVSGTGQIHCNTGTVTWLDDKMVTITRASSPVLLSCTGTLPTGKEGSRVVVNAINTGKSTSNYWLNGSGQATFTCVKESGDYKWKTSAGFKKCSTPPVTTEPVVYY